MRILLKYSAFSGAILIFFGVLKLILFYQAFDINIIDYIKISEIITSFLDDIHVLILISLVLLLQSVPLLNAMGRKSGLSLDEYYDHLLKSIYPLRRRFIVVFIVPFIILAILLLTNLIQARYVYIYLLVFFWLQIITYIGMHKDEKEEIELAQTSQFFSFVGAVFIAVFLLAKHDVNIHKSNNQEVKIVTNDGILNCNSWTKKKYIGKTESYIFIQDQYKNENVIVPLSQVKRISICKPE